MLVYSGTHVQHKVSASRWRRQTTKDVIETNGTPDGFQSATRHVRSRLALRRPDRQVDARRSDQQRQTLPRRTVHAKVQRSPAAIVYTIAMGAPISDKAAASEQRPYL